MSQIDTRVELLERRVATLERLVRDAGAAAPTLAPTGPASTATVDAPPAPAPAPGGSHRAAPDPTRVVAAVGGLLLVAGAVFFLALAISRGWLTHELQVALAELVGLAALGASWRVLETSTRTDMRRVAGVLGGVGAGIAQLGLAAGATLYQPHVLAPALALPLAGAVAAATVLLAVRHRMQPLAAFALTTGLLAPTLVSAGTSLLALAFGAVALVGAAAVVAVRGWPWLAQVAIWTSAPQLLVFLEDCPLEATTIATARELALLGLVAGSWWLLLAAGIVGHVLRVRRGRLDAACALALAAATSVAAALMALPALLGDHPAGHVELGVLLAGLAALVLATAAGVSRRVGGAAAAIWLAALAAGVAAAAATSLLAGRDGVPGLPALIAAWSVEGIALAWLWRRTRERRVAAVGALLLGLTALVALVAAPPEALLYGLRDLVPGVLAVAALAGGLAGAAALLRGERAGALLARGAGVAALYAASVLLVGVLTDEATRGDGPVGQSAQLALSAFWALAGLALVAAALARRARAARYAGAGLLLAAAAKVLVLDTSTLDAGYRVAAFVLGGAVLLAGAFLLARLDHAGGDEGGSDSGR